jgi:hypothetical protein
MHHLSALLLKKPLLRQPRLLGEIGELALNRCAMDVEQPRTPAHRNTSTQ